VFTYQLAIAKSSGVLSVQICRTLLTDDIVLKYHFYVSGNYHRQDQHKFCKSTKKKQVLQLN